MRGDGIAAGRFAFVKRRGILRCINILRNDGVQFCRKSAARSSPEFAAPALNQAGDTRKSRNPRAVFHTGHISTFQKKPVSGSKSGAERMGLGGVFDKPRGFFAVRVVVWAQFTRCWARLNRGLGRSGIASVGPWMTGGSRRHRGRSTLDPAHTKRDLTRGGRFQDSPGPKERRTTFAAVFSRFDSLDLEYRALLTGEHRYTMGGLFARGYRRTGCRKGES